MQLGPQIILVAYFFSSSSLLYLLGLLWCMTTLQIVLRLLNNRWMKMVIQVMTKVMIKLVMKVMMIHPKV